MTYVVAGQHFKHHHRWEIPGRPRLLTTDSNEEIMSRRPRHHINMSTWQRPTSRRHLWRRQSNSQSCRGKTKTNIASLSIWNAFEEILANKEVFMFSGAGGARKHTSESLESYCSLRVLQQMCDENIIRQCIIHFSRHLHRNVQTAASSRHMHHKNWSGQTRRHGRWSDRVQSGD